MLGGTPHDLEELKARAGHVGVGEEDALLLAPFVGLGGAPPAVRMADEQRKRQVFAGVWQFLFAVCRERPVFVTLEDVHWADESSRDLLDFLLERLGGVPLMLVLSYRPGLEQIDRAELRASHTAVRLEPLTPVESVALACGFLGVAALPPDLERLVVGRAEGNPFFIEELLQALLELGSLAVVNGSAVLAKVEAEVPDTVQGTILARVDRLDASARSVLQHATVLGRSFAVELLEAVMGNGPLSEPLEALTRSQLLVAPAPGQLAFKHALIQEVTYETLLMRQRRELHRKVAETLEQRGGDDPSVLETLAEHYARAEAPEKARGYALAAGDLARERMGFVEAKRRYEAALRLWGEGDEEGRLELLMKLGHAALLAGDSATARTALVEAEEGWRERGDAQHSGAALAALGRVYWVAGDPDRAAGAVDRAISILGELAPSPELVQAYTWASALHMLAGGVDEGTQLAQRGLALATELGLDGFRAHLLNTLGACQAFEGDVRGVEKMKDALALAQRVGEVEALGRAYNNLASTLPELGRALEAVEVASEGREAMRKLGVPSFEWFIAGNQAAALVALGRLDEADALTREILEEQRDLLVNAAGPRIVALVRLGRYEEARALLDEVLPGAERIGGAEFLAPLRREEAELEHVRGNLAAARQAIREATEIAFSTPAVIHWLHLLPAAARLLDAKDRRASRARDGRALVPHGRRAARRGRGRRQARRRPLARSGSHLRGARDAVRGGTVPDRCRRARAGA